MLRAGSASQTASGRRLLKDMDLEEIFGGACRIGDISNDFYLTPRSIQEAEGIFSRKVQYRVGKENAGSLEFDAENGGIE
jgi:hypothetical protein